MKQRMVLIWLALLTVYVSITITDMWSTLKTVENCQESTLTYMKKSTRILARLKSANMLVKKGQTGPFADDLPAGTSGETADRPRLEESVVKESNGAAVANSLRRS